MRKTKLVLGLVGFGFILWIFSTRDTEVLGIVSADAFTTAADATAQLNKHATNMSLIITFLEFFAFFFFNILSYLLEPELLLGMIGSGGDQVLNTIWRVSRDIMNIIFAFLLVVGAIVTVITAKREYLAQYAVKFALAVILVNFSWFFPRVILDVSHVLTATIYQLPSLVTAQTGYECKISHLDCNDGPDAGTDIDVATECNLVTNPCLYIKKISYLDQARADCKDTAGKPRKSYVAGNVCVEYDTLGNDSNTPYGILNGLIYNYGRLGELTSVAKITTVTGGVVRDATVRGSTRIEDYVFFLIHTAMVMLFSIALFLPLAAMVVVFLIRIPIIWLTIAFMPFIFMGFVIGDKMGSFNTMELIGKKFLSAAFLPAAVAVPFAVGFIMIAANSSQPPIGIADSLAVVGSTANPLNNAAPTLWDLLWLGITFFVIWKGFFSALKIDKTFEKVGGFFEGWGNRIGNFAMKAPLAIPIIGTPGRGQTPLNVLNTVLRPGSLIRGGKLGGFNDANRRAAGSLTKQELTDALRANAATKRSVDAKISQIWNIAAGDPDKKRKVEAILSDIRTETGFDVHDQQSIRDFIQGVKDGGGLPAHINEAQLQSKLEDALDI